MRKKKEERKDYMVVFYNNTYINGIWQCREWFEFTEAELKKYIQEQGDSKIKCVLKNEPLNIETIVEITEN